MSARTDSTTIQPPLTYDDLIDLHFLLQADGLFLRLMADSLLATVVR